MYFLLRNKANVGFPAVDQHLKMTDGPTLINSQMPTQTGGRRAVLVGQHWLSCDGSTFENRRWSHIDKQSATDTNR